MKNNEFLDPTSQLLDLTEDFRS